MPVFKLPLSGDVVQSIYPSFFSPAGGQFGLVNITTVKERHGRAACRPKRR